MKKVLMLLLSIVCVWNAYAQDVDSLQVQSEPITIDSLVVRLDKLQHDYDFMSCEYELFKHKAELDALAKDINIKINGVLIDVYHTRYDRELYKTFTESYDSSSALYDSYKDKFDSVKRFVVYKVLTCDFNETEIAVLDASLESIQHSFAIIEAGLNYYDAAIQNYKGKR